MATRTEEITVMYDKGNSIHNNGAKLGNSLKQMNGVKHALAEGTKASAARESKAQDKPAPLTKTPK